MSITIWNFCCDLLLFNIVTNISIAGFMQGQVPHLRVMGTVETSGFPYSRLCG